MPDSSAHRAVSGLAVPTLAMALVLVLVSGTFAALLVSVRGVHESARQAEEILAAVGVGASAIVLILLGVYLRRTALLADALGAREEQLRVSRNHLLANVSHEIRTPLSGVIGMTELLLQSDLEPEQRAFAQTAARSGGALLGVINDILDFSHGSYAAVFMDCQMPNLDGYAATGRIRAQESGGERLPVIAMTAHAMTGDRERCLDAGMDDYLSKPLRPEALDLVLERCLGVAPGGVAAPEAEAPADALIDEARMRTFRDEYPDIVDQLVDLFLTSTPPLLDELRDAADSGDRDEVRRAAHKLKGSCQNIGATFMATLCRSIETGAGDVHGNVAKLGAALEPTESAIRRALAAA